MDVDKIELNVSKTIYKTDYQIPKLTQQVRHHEWTNVKPAKPEEKTIEQKTYSVKDVHTMQPWRSKVPFNVLWQPEPIIRTHPWHMKFGNIQTKLEVPKKNETIKNRPRVTMAPATSMDDITDSKIRSQLCNYIYKSEWTSASGEIKFKVRDRHIPNTTLERSADPVRDNNTIYKPLPTGWKQKGKQWERKQYTTLVKPTKAFWLNYKHTLNTPAGCDPFKNMISADTRKEIRELIEKDELRLTYDKTKPGYTGYRPRLVTGQLRKQELQITTN